MKHWYDGFGWEMANCMCEQVLKKTQTIVVKANFFSLIENEVIMLIINLSFQCTCMKCMHGK